MHSNLSAIMATDRKQTFYFFSNYETSWQKLGTILENEMFDKCSDQKVRIMKVILLLFDILRSNIILDRFRVSWGWSSLWAWGWTEVCFEIFDKMQQNTTNLSILWRHKPMLRTTILRILRSKIYYINQFSYLMVLLKAFHRWLHKDSFIALKFFLAFEVKPYYWEVPSVTKDEFHFTI